MSKITNTERPPRTVSTQPAGGTMGQKPISTASSPSDGEVPHFATSVGKKPASGPPAPGSVGSQPASGVKGQPPMSTSQNASDGEVPNFGKNVGHSQSTKGSVGGLKHWSGKD